MKLTRSGTRSTFCVWLLVAMGACATSAQATVMTIVNEDKPGEGLNDPTPVSPVGGNRGTTLGEQRKNALQFAADFWGRLLDSSAEIRIDVKFDPLPCSNITALLGSAGAVAVVSDFVNAPVAGTFFPIALARALAFPTDPLPGTDDIAATFTSKLEDTRACAFPYNFYYGLDGNAPYNRIDFVTVALHELGHGLGFFTLVNLATGAKPEGLDDAYMRNLEDHNTSLLYPDMTNDERVAASRDTGNLHWVGAHVRATSGVLIEGTVGDHVQMYAPDRHEIGSSVSHFDTALNPDELMEPFLGGTLRDVGLAFQALQDMFWPTFSVPRITVTPRPFDYGSLATGSVSDQVFTVRNTGTATLTVTSTQITGVDASQFSILGGVNGFVLAPNATQQMTVRFTPAAPSGRKNAALSFSSDDPNAGTKDIPLTGKAIAPMPLMLVSPIIFNFGTVTVGKSLDHTFTVSNLGTDPLTVTSTQITGMDASQFSILGVDGFVLAPNASQDMTVRFTPAAPAGTKSAAVRFVSDDPELPVFDDPIFGTAFVAVHDLAVVKVIVPAVVNAIPATPVTRSVQVQVQNRSNHSEVLTSAAALGDGTTTGLVRLGASVVDDDGEACHPAAVGLDVAKNAALFKHGPVTWKSKARITVNFLATYECDAPKSKSDSDPTPGDYQYLATVHHDAIDGLPDGHPDDDACPHDALATPSQKDPHPDGTIIDRGCGARKPDGTSGNPVVTDVIR